MFRIILTRNLNLDMRRLGPCSVEALKSGILYLKWDAPGFASLLNGNRSNSVVYPNGNKRLISKNLFYIDINTSIY